jgi:phospholipid/cholesterol/gamma-HCH transport system permease protein
VPTQSHENAVVIPPMRLPRRLIDSLGYRVISFGEAVHGLGAFLLIALGVAVTKFQVAPRVMIPLICAQVHRAGVRLLPMISFLGTALGLVVIGQTVFLLNRFGAQNYSGIIMVTVVVRELGPMITAIVVLARAGAATVIELGTARALGEVEALEALSIDPIHYLVVPRVIGLALSIFTLTVYLILVALISGYVFAFLQDVPLLPSDYFNQLAGVLIWQDFILLALKTFAFGVLIAVVTSYEGLARPLRIDDVANVTTRAVARCVVAAVLVDALFIIIYLVMT